jgi:hypothetical protein
MKAGGKVIFKRNLLTQKIKKQCFKGDSGATALKLYV